MKKILFILVFVNSCMVGLLAGEPDSSRLFTPKIEGTIRSKYEYNSALDAHRFQVRNARFSINGHFSQITSYKAEIDLSDEGVTKMLDAYVRFTPLEWFVFTIGQQKIPFGTDNLRSPHQLYFANRSFVGKQLSSGFRDVGATMRFINKKTLPFEVQAGIYNGDGLYNQKGWQTEMNYALRLEVFPTKSSELSINYNSVKPDALRMNLLDIGAYVNISALHLESEYIYKTYESDVFPATHSFLIFGAYDIWLNKKMLRKITPLVRFDLMTENNKGIAHANGTYGVDDVASRRITSGITFSLAKPFCNDIRLNYEKYFHNDGIDNTNDKFVIEFVVRF